MSVVSQNRTQICLDAFAASNVKTRKMLGKVSQRWRCLGGMAGDAIAAILPVITEMMADQVNL